MPVDYRSESTYSATRLPVELASTLVPDAYRSDAFMSDEQVDSLEDQLGVCRLRRACWKYWTDNRA